jgi:hypothetical protein
MYQRYSGYGARLSDEISVAILSSAVSSLFGEFIMRVFVTLLIVASLTSSAMAQEYLGQLGGNEFNYNSTNNEFGAGSPFRPNGINNSIGVYGSETSDLSARNPFARNAPKLYDSQGNYRGKLSANEFDPESISNPYGRYGSPYSPDSINNPYGAGSEFRYDSPNNPYGPGWKIVGGR